MRQLTTSLKLLICSASVTVLATLLANLDEQAPVQKMIAISPPLRSPEALRAMRVGSYEMVNFRFQLL